jgi:hypothetical protein
MISEEIEAIRANLEAIDMITGGYDITTNTFKYHITTSGLRVYVTLLYMTGATNLFNGPRYTKEYTRRHYYEISKDLVISQGFIKLTADNLYVLTPRGAEHITVMFDLYGKKRTSLIAKLNRFFKFR